MTKDALIALRNAAKVKAYNEPPVPDNAIEYGEYLITYSIEDAYGFIQPTLAVSRLDKKPVGNLAPLTDELFPVFGYPKVVFQRVYPKRGDTRLYVMAKPEVQSGGVG